MKKRKILTAVFSVALSASTMLFASACKEEAIQPPVSSSNKGEIEIITKIDKPTIVIDALEEIPNATINKPYKFFDATAFDAYGVEIDVNVKVWRFYHSETASFIDFSEQFIPTEYGTYTVEYSATDKVGNKVIETYNFSCVEKEALDADLDLSSVLTECEVGDEIEVATATPKNFNGEVNCKVYAVSTNSGVITEVVDGKFVPTYTGDYEIKYEVKDYNETAIKSYTIEVKEYDKPKVYGDVLLAKYYILGCEYKLPELNCVSYMNGEPAKIQPDVYVIYDGEVPELVDANAFVPEKEGPFRIKYVATLNGKTEERTYLSTCVDTGYETGIMIEKYFYVEGGMQVTPLDFGVKLTAREETCGADFINALLSRTFTMTFAFDQANNFEKFNVYFEDSANSDIRVKIGMFKTATGEVQFSINDGASTYKTVIDFNENATFSMNYDESTRSIVVGDSVPVMIRRDLKGNDFKGFTSGSMYVSYELSGVNSTSSVSVETIDNQTLYEGCDYAAPYVVYNRYSDGYKRVGDLIEIDRIYIGGVLLPNFEVEYYAKGPDGNAPKDVSGIVMNKENMMYNHSYQFRPQTEGKYSINISAENPGKSAFYSYSIVVDDFTPPIITLEGEAERQYKLGDELTVLKATVTDNMSETNLLCIYIYAPDGVLYQYNENEKFILNQVGKYTVYYQALDEAENVAMTSYTFEVVK